MIWTKDAGEDVWIHVISYENQQNVESHEWDGKIKNIKKAVANEVSSINQQNIALKVEMSKQNLAITELKSEIKYEI